jgi:AcrR family transcriptional regulator
MRFRETGLEYERSLTFKTRVSAMSKSTAAQRLKPRKSPVQRRSAQTVETVLEAAARILETDGLAAYTTNAVAERAGVSIGSLYQYFPNRDALTVALIERETAQLVADIESASLVESSRGCVLAMVRAAVAHQMRRPELARIIDFEERRLPLGERHQRVADVIHAALLRALTDKPEAPDLEDASLVAHDLLAIVRGMVDDAGEREERDAAALEVRVMRAVDGYVALSRRVSGESL